MFLKLLFNLKRKESVFPAERKPAVRITDEAPPPHSPNPGRSIDTIFNFLLDPFFPFSLSLF